MKNSMNNEARTGIATAEDTRYNIKKEVMAMKKVI